MLFRWSKKEEKDKLGMVGNLGKRDYLKDLRIGGKIKLRGILKRNAGRVCARLIWLRTGTSGRFL